MSNTAIKPSAKLNAEQALSFIASMRGNIKGQRLGQALFNKLCETHNELAESIRTTPADPFYSDKVVPDFFEAIVAPEAHSVIPKAFRK